MPKVSVVIPLYNKAGTIGRAIRSVLGQSFSDIELIVVDDGSTDGGPAEVDGFADPRVTVIHQPNLGPGSARNRGAKDSTAPLLAFLDADDEWEPDYLEISARHLDSAPEAAAHVSGYFKGPERLDTESASRSFGIMPGRWRIDPATPGRSTKRFVDFCHSSCVVVRREVFDHYGGFYDKDRCLYGEDSYLWLMLVMNENLLLNPGPLVWFHSEDSSLGERMRGNHPRRPALSDPEPLRLRCDPSRRMVLEDLLAFYRLIETEKLASHGETSEIRALRKSFPWRRRIDFGLLKRELRVEIGRWKNALGAIGGMPLTR